MATLETALSVFSGNAIRHRHSPHFLVTNKQLASLKFQLSFAATATSSASYGFLHTSFPVPSRGKNSNKLGFELCVAAEEMAVEDAPEQNIKRKLYVYNLPWTLSGGDLKNLLAQCGTVKDVEIIKHKTGKSRGFAFVTMSSGEEAQAVVEKFDSFEISGRIIRVEFAKRLRKPAPPSPTPPPPATDTRHKLYVSNLAWKVRSTHLREFFAENFNPVSSRVVFESPTGRSAGYGFVSFATKEEADAALSALDGKELMGRPIRLKLSDKNITESEDHKEEEEAPADQAESEEEPADQAESS